jgi:hypothetical protein
LEETGIRSSKCILGSGTEWAYIHIIVDIVGLLGSLLDGLLVVRLAYTQRRAYTAHRSSRYNYAPIVASIWTRRDERRDDSLAHAKSFTQTHAGRAWCHIKPSLWEGRTKIRRLHKPERARPGKFVRQL